MARLLVMGQSGTGKSWALGALLERILDEEHPNHPGETFDFAVHFDPEDEERGLCEKGNPLYKTLVVDRQTARQINWPKLVAQRERIRVVPDMDEESMQTLFGILAQSVFRLCKDDLPDKTCLLSCDESGDIVPQHGAHDAALRVQSRGRKHGVETIHAAQRPQQLNSSIISQTDRRYYFRINNDNDLSKLNSQAGFNVNRIPSGVESEHIDPGEGLRDLPDRTVVSENVSTGEILVQSTEEWIRMRNHHSGDDGILDSGLRI
jgi:GTPase SAR1 family protein